MTKKNSKTRSATALAVIAGAALISERADAQTSGGDYVAANMIEGVRDARLLDNGDVELTLDDGRVVRIAAENVMSQNGVIMIDTSAVAEAGLAAGAAAGGGSGLLLGGLAALAAGGAALAGGGGGGEVAPDAPAAPPAANILPAFTSGTTISVAENNTATGYTAAASDANGDPITFSISGGADAARFSINSTTGVLTFNASPNFEAPSDANGDNRFEVTVAASDGRGSVQQNVVVTVTNVNDVAPLFTSAATASAAENRTTAFTATATDAEGEVVTFSLSGADASLFTINAATGVVTFRAAPNFEAPADAGANNVYDLIVTASDGVNSTTQAVAVTVTNVPNITGTAGDDELVGTAAVEELEGLAGDDRLDSGGGSDTITSGSGNDTLVFAGDPFDGVDVSAPGRQVVGNEDFITDFDFANDVYEFNARDFGIEGELSFVSLDANAPGAVIPAGANVIVLLNSDDDGNAATPFNAITSAVQVAGLTTTDGPGFIVYWNSALNVTRIIYSSNLNDPAADLKIVSRHTDLTGQAAIDALESFTAANFDFDRAPVFTSAATASAPENRTTAFTAVAADGDGSVLRYSLSGTDAALFTVNTATGVVTFKAAPDFEAPLDDGADNVYDLIVTASEGLNETTQEVAVTVTDIPNITGTAGDDELVGTAAVEELEGLAGDDRLDSGGGSDTITSGSGSDTLVFGGDPFDGVDVSAPGRQVVGNEDFITDFDFANDVYEFNARDFGIEGELSFVSLDANAPGAVIPAGANVIVLLNSDDDGNAATPFNAITSAVQVAGLTTTDGPGFIVYWNSALDVTRIIYSSNLNDPAADLKIVSRHTDLTGQAAIDALESFTAANFDFDRAPVFTSAATASAPENRTTAFTAVAADGDGSVLRYSLSGTDAALFTVNTATGVVTFKAAPDFEAPLDDGADNVYDLIVTASDGLNETTQEVAVTVTDIPNITGTAGDDELVGTAAVEELEGLAGDDRLDSGGGSDTITLGSGNDTLVFAGDPFDGVDVSAPGRQVVGNEDFITDFDFATPVTSVAVTTASATTAAVLDAALAGNIYFNLHSITFPAGEVRGQLVLASDDRAANGTGSVTFTSVLNGANEVPAVDTEAEGTGSITFTVAADGSVSYTTQIDVRNFDVSQLTIGHLHEGAVGVSGPVVVDLVATARTASGSITGSTERDVYEFNARDFGIEDELSFVSLDANAPGAVIPAGANVIVLLNSDDDGNAATPFNAITSAVQVAGLTTTDGPGFIVYWNSALDVTRIIYSSNLNDPAADLKIVSRHTDLTGQAAIDALESFTAANFDFDRSLAFTSAATVSVAENQRAAFTAVAVGGNGSPLTYSLTGPDAGVGLFTINSATGVVTFRAAPDFETPSDEDADNVYDLIVTASDGVDSITQTVTLTVTDVIELTGTAGDDTLIGTAAVEQLDALAGNDRLDGGGGSDTIRTGAGSDTLVYAGDPFDGVDVSAPGRQVVGNEDFITDFDFANDVYEFNARDFGIEGELNFVSLDANAPDAVIPAGANVIVLLNSDDDGNAATPFNAITSAVQVAGLTTTDGPGFIVYWNSALNVTRIIYSSNLNDPAADLKIVSRHTDLTGQAAIDALESFTAANFDFDGDVITGTEDSDELTGFGGDDVISGLGGSDIITTNGGSDSIAYDRTAIGSVPDIIVDFSLEEDKFLLDADDFGIVGPLKFQNELAANLIDDGSNVIVLRDIDDDADSATVFGARSAAELIGGVIATDGPGFFVYINSALNLNRLVFSENLADGQAEITVLGAIDSASGQAAIDQLALYESGNFEFGSPAEALNSLASETLTEAEETDLNSGSGNAASFADEADTFEFSELDPLPTDPAAPEGPGFMFEMAETGFDIWQITTPDAPIAAPIEGF